MREEQVERVEDRACAEAQEALSRLSGVFVDSVVLPVLPQGALWPDRFETVGEAEVSQWVERCQCCGPVPERQRVPARFEVEVEGDQAMVKVEFEFSLDDRACHGGISTGGVMQNVYEPGACDPFLVDLREFLQLRDEENSDDNDEDNDQEV